MIIPFPGQTSLRKQKTNSVNAPSVRTETLKLSVKQEAKILTSPIDNLNTSNVSINEMLQKEQENKTLQSKNLPKEIFTKEDVIRWWKTNAHQQKANEQEQLCNIMLKRELIQLNETTYQFEVENNVQLSRINGFLSEIVHFIREKIKNHELIIQLHVSSDSQPETKHLTGQDKFEKMAKKNSNLFDLKNRFNLDIDF